MVLKSLHSLSPLRGLGARMKEQFLMKAVVLHNEDILSSHVLDGET